MFTRLTRGQTALDIGGALVYFLICFAPLNRNDQFVSAIIALLFAISLGFRRFSPIISLSIAWAAALFQMYFANVQPGIPDLAILGVLYTNARWGDRRIRWFGFASVFVGAVLGAIYLVWGSNAPTIGVSFGVRSVAEAAGTLVKLVFNLGLLVGLLGLPWTAGTLVRTRGAARESRAAEQNAQREMEAAEQDVIVEQERNRIARDMHDVVAHSLAVVIAQADGARYAKENDPAAVDGALSAISSTAREALADVRLLLGQLRHPQTEGPQPALADLGRLLDQLRASGLTVAFTTKGSPLQLGTGQQLAVYRIVQEALTNALRHGERQEEVTVKFEWMFDELQITITSAVTSSPATAELRVGHGLAGMKERAALVGGHLTTNVDDRHFVVVATIPRNRGGPRVSASINVALVDDQALFRTGIRMLVSSQPDLKFVGEAANGVDGIALAASAKPDVILMDIRMPVMDGIQSTEAILSAADARGGARPRIIVLTTFDLDEAATRAIRGGASGFLLKDADPEFLLAAIRTVHAGTSVIAAAATRELFQHFDSQSANRVAPPEFNSLTSREHDIFLLAARGLSNSEIARGEFLSEATVKTHISRILSKLSLRDRVQLVVFAFENGLVD